VEDSKTTLTFARCYSQNVAHNKYQTSNQHIRIL